MGAPVGGDSVIRLLTRVLFVGAVVLATLGAVGCRRPKQSEPQGAEARLPEVRADSEGLLLTWIDDKGDFHVETRVADVPLMGRDTVRVVDPGKDETSGTEIVVADFRQAGATGAYPARTMARADFEAIAVARRQQAGPTLAAAGAASAPGSPGSDTASQAAGAAAALTKPSTRPIVIIYGAEWCGACHDAARYLRKKGVAYVEKDIEKEPDAAREMQQKLASRGLRGGSIPVIDVRGKVMVGFDPREIDAALGQAM
jgi:glutaredoxin